MNAIGPASFTGANLQISSQVAVDRKFWDVEIVNTDSPENTLVIECKCGAPSTEKQLLQYRGMLAKRTNGKGQLISLARTHTGSNHIDNQITWTDVAKLLWLSSSPDPETRFILTCFAEFLKDKGMVIPKLVSLEAGSEPSVQGIQLWSELPAFFEFFRTQEFLKEMRLGFTKPQPNNHPTCSWFGVYSASERAYVGVGASYFDASPLKLFAFTQFTFPNFPSVSRLSPELTRLGEIGTEWASKEAEAANWMAEFKNNERKVFNFAESLWPELTDSNKLLRWFNCILTTFVGALSESDRDHLRS